MGSSDSDVTIVDAVIIDGFLKGFEVNWWNIIRKFGNCGKTSGYGETDAD